MPVLPNPRHEAFAQALAKGKSATEAYAVAGYRPHQPSASRLLSNAMVAARVAELQSKAAKRAEVTIESLADELDEARAIALTEKLPSAAIAATMGKAKLYGKIVEKRQHSGPNGGPIPTVDLTNMSADDLDRLEALFGPLAGASGDDAEDDPAGEGEAGG